MITMDFYDYKNIQNYARKINRDIFVYLILEGWLEYNFNFVHFW